ncbi:hypothetical protein C8A00DRAFT_33134 [Chaetomidium leptoderma]|uniref:2EXR domain-containing protein n=1 Tax=Chaetomidium leptoderma TaxID=669021 RepID=A0AAN6VML0_9PEZI|nr:hypothetical protein C8A00DRAFT_33134 [Chaetomidium leptoderma]
MATQTQITRTSATQAQQSGWSKLPAELRLDIYKLTWEPRAVRLDRITGARIKLGPLALVKQYDATVTKLRVASVPPKTLHINAEARAETLRHYVPFFRTNGKAGREEILYFNPSLDVLFVSHFPALDIAHPRENRDSARFFNAFSVASKVCVTGDLRDYLAVLTGVANLNGEDQNRWFPQGIPDMDHWGLAAQNAITAWLWHINLSDLWSGKPDEPARRERMIRDYGWAHVLRMDAAKATFRASMKHTSLKLPD